MLKKNQMSVALSFEVHTYKTIKSSKSSVLIIPTYMCEEFIAGIKHKVVGNLTDGLQVEQATSVPLISKYHTEEGRAMYGDFATECYGDDAELWAYT